MDLIFNPVQVLVLTADKKSLCDHDRVDLIEMRDHMPRAMLLLNNTPSMMIRSTWLGTIPSHSVSITEVDTRGDRCVHTVPIALYGAWISTFCSKREPSALDLYGDDGILGNRKLALSFFTAFWASWPIENCF